MLPINIHINACTLIRCKWGAWRKIRDCSSWNRIQSRNRPRWCSSATRYRKWRPYPRPSTCAADWESTACCGTGPHSPRSSSTDFSSSRPETLAVASGPTERRYDQFRHFPQHPFPCSTHHWDVIHRVPGLQVIVAKCLSFRCTAIGLRLFGQCGTGAMPGRLSVLDGVTVALLWMGRLALGTWANSQKIAEGLRRPLHPHVQRTNPKESQIFFCYGERTQVEATGNEETSTKDID